eukprot:403338451
MVELKKKTIDDYEFQKQIGEGAYGNVYLAKDKESGSLFAIKALEKLHIIKFNKTKSVHREKEILNKFKSHPNIIKLESTFQDKQNLYFVFEHCPNGTLASLIQKNCKFSEEVVRIYAAEIINVLETIHTENVMHRDLKPENILVTKDLHLKIIDFGDAKYIIDPEAKKPVDTQQIETSTTQDTETDDFQPKRNSDVENQGSFSDQNSMMERRGTFVGTAFYVSPEMLKENKATSASDLWALGCTIYKMLTGEVPFQGSSDYFTFNMILERKLDWPADCQISQEAKDLVDQLLQLNPLQRLGAGAIGTTNDYAALKSHLFFKDVDFSTLNSLQIPLKRKVSDSDSSTNQQTWSDVGEDEENIVLYQGELKKRNKFYWNQVRFFVLSKNGTLNYYKDKQLLRGFIKLCKDTKIVKTAKDKFEIQCPQRTFYLSESDNYRLSSDEWIEKISEIIEKMKVNNSISSQQQI